MSYIDDYMKWVGENQTSGWKYPGYKPVTSETIALSPEKVKKIEAGEQPLPQISTEAREKAVKAALDNHNETLAKENKHSLFVLNEDIGPVAFYLESKSGLSPLEMGSLVGKAITSPDDSGDAVTQSMDLVMSKAKLNSLVDKFIPAEYRQEAAAKVDSYIQKKTAESDNILTSLNQAALAAARQAGDAEGINNAQHQLDLLSSGLHPSQTQRREMLDLTSSSDSSDWFSGFHAMVSQGSSASSPYYSIELEHISKLQTQWDTFMAEVSRQASAQ
ncbi:hypothetical protein [Pantoea ananatis]|uniref:hypothetical protein n=1 Tax=Pantoea ananas TaxID=553 RepID=UPI001EE534A6|nr:hypothetical protein [Pantoea ananatis]PKC45639.1 hypothetical protein V461_06305 [Pantoea ananatis BRT98]